MWQFRSVTCGGHVIPSSVLSLEEAPLCFCSTKLWRAQPCRQRAPNMGGSLRLFSVHLMHRDAVPGCSTAEAGGWNVEVTHDLVLHPPPSVCGADNSRLRRRKQHWWWDGENRLFRFQEETRRRVRRRFGKRFYQRISACSSVLW